MRLIAWRHPHTHRQLCPRQHPQQQLWPVTARVGASGQNAAADVYQLAWIDGPQTVWCAGAHGSLKRTASARVIVEVAVIVALAVALAVAVVEVVAVAVGVGVIIIADKTARACCAQMHRSSSSSSSTGAGISIRSWHRAQRRCLRASHGVSAPTSVLASGPGGYGAACPRGSVIRCSWRCTWRLHPLRLARRWSARH